MGEMSRNVYNNERSIALRIGRDKEVVGGHSKEDQLVGAKNLYNSF